jgi:glycosyltransferase involved in cell wall biosynthesis
VRGRFLAEVGASAGRVHVFPCGLDTTKLPRRPKEKIVAFAGRIVLDKGVVELVRSLRLRVG